MRNSSEKGDPARLVQRKTGSNDIVWATIKKMPFPLHNRELVSRQVCCSDVNGDLLFTSVPADEVTDYGTKTKTVRGVILALMRLVPDGLDQCKVTYHMYLDAGGQIPTFVVNAKIPLALGAVGDLRDAFQRDDEIDKLERDELARVIKDEPQTYIAEEDILINEVHVKLGMLEWEHFEELESPDHLVRMGKIFVDGGSSSAAGRASTIVDVSVGDCAAWEMAKMSRENRKIHVADGGLERDFRKENEHHGLLRVVLDLHIPGLQPREFLSAQVWRRQGDKLAAVYDNVEHEDFPLDVSLVRGTTQVYLEYEKLKPVGGLPQTRVTFTQQIDLGGLIPKSLVNGSVVKTLVYLSAMRQRFDKSLEIDGATRTLNVEMIMGHEEEYSVHENWFVAQGEKLFADFQEMKAKELEMASPLTTAKIAYNSGDHHAWGYATPTVRARPEEVLAFVWDVMKRSARWKDEMEKSVDERKNEHNLLYYSRKKSPFEFIKDRDFLARAVWRRKEDGSLIFVASSESSPNRPEAERVVRAKNPNAMSIKRKNDQETIVEYVIHPDAGGHIPSFLMNRGLGKSLSTVTAIQEYFQALRGLEEWDTDDARAAGEAMCIKTKAEKHHEKGESKVGARVRELFKKQKGLNQIGRKYEFFQNMITRVIKNKLRTAGAVKSKLCSVSLKEGETIGRGLAMALASNLTAEAAVDEWILKYKRSLGELDRTEAWFR